MTAQTSFRPAGPSTDKTVSHVLGEITWLLSQSPVHKNLFIADLEWMIMPPVLIEQFRIFYGPESPGAVAIWAKVSEETNARLEAGATKLRPDEWASGDIPWLIELITPFGAQEEVLKDLETSVFDGKPFKFHTTTPQGKIVKTWPENP